MKTAARRPKNQQQDSFQPSRRQQLRQGAEHQQQTPAAACSSTAAKANPEQSFNLYNKPKPSSSKPATKATADTTCTPTKGGTCRGRWTPGSNPEVTSQRRKPNSSKP